MSPVGPQQTHCVVTLDRLPTTREAYDTQFTAGGSTQHKTGYPRSATGKQQIRKDERP